MHCPASIFNDFEIQLPITEFAVETCYSYNQWVFYLTAISIITSITSRVAFLH